MRGEDTKTLLEGGKWEWGWGESGNVGKSNVANTIWA